MTKERCRNRAASSQVDFFFFYSAIVCIAVSVGWCECCRTLHGYVLKRDLTQALNPVEMSLGHYNLLK